MLTALMSPNDRECKLNSLDQTVLLCRYIAFFSLRGIAEWAMGQLQIIAMWNASHFKRMLQCQPKPLADHIFTMTNCSSWFDSANLNDGPGQQHVLWLAAMRHPDINTANTNCRLGFTKTLAKLGLPSCSNVYSNQVHKQRQAYHHGSGMAQQVSASLETCRSDWSTKFRSINKTKASNDQNKPSNKHDWSLPLWHCKPRC